MRFIKKIHQQLEKSNQQISDLQEEKNEITKDLAQKVQELENRLKIEEKLRMEIESKNRRIKQLEIRSPNKNQKRKKLNNSDSSDEESDTVEKSPRIVSQNNLFSLYLFYYSETPIKATKMSRF
jgi:predicted RNase H-like nuclease (RuvC/YqgF family)